MKKKYKNIKENNKKGFKFNFGKKKIILHFNLFKQIITLFKKGFKFKYGVGIIIILIEFLIVRVFFDGNIMIFCILFSITILYIVHWNLNVLLACAILGLFVIFIITPFYNRGSINEIIVNKLVLGVYILLVISVFGYTIDIILYNLFKQKSKKINNMQKRHIQNSANNLPRQRRPIIDIKNKYNNKI
jgi:hypothetical protein